MGRACSMNEYTRWTKKITKQCPYNDKRSKKRPDTTWRDRSICRKT